MENITIKNLDTIDKITINPYGQQVCKPACREQQYVYVDTRKER